MGRITAVDPQTGAGDVAGGFAQEEDDRTAEVMLVGHAPEKSRACVAFDKGSGLTAEKTARGNTVHANAARTVMGRGKAREIHHPGFVEKIVGNRVHVQSFV